MHPITWSGVRKAGAAFLILGNTLQAPAATITVNNPSGAHNVAGSCVLRDAITAATAYSGGGCVAVRRLVPT